MRLQAVAQVRVGVSTPGDGSEADFLQGRSISPAFIEREGLSTGAMPSDAAAEGRLSAGDVVVALRGTSNPVAIVRDKTITPRPCFATLDVAIVRVDGSVALPEYVAAVMNLPRVQNELARGRVGDVTPRLPLPVLAGIDVPIPELRRQEQVVRLIEGANEEQRLLVRLAALRRTQINELLAKSLWEEAEEPVPGSHPARAESAQDDRAAVP